MNKFIKSIKKEIAELVPLNLSKELKDLAIIKKVMVILSAHCCRDDNFFLRKEEIRLRMKLYNKPPRFKRGKINQVSCKSFCRLLCKILQALEINALPYSSGSDPLRHFAVIYKHGYNTYFIDPLFDLINLKIGAPTTHFVCEYKKLDNLSLITNDNHQLIDNVIKYPVNKLAGLMNSFASAHDSELLIKIIEKSLSEKLNSVADNIIYINYFIEQLMDTKNKDKLFVSYCLVHRKFIKKHLSPLRKKQKEKAVYISFKGDSYFIFPHLNQYFSIPEQETLNNKSQIYIRTKPVVALAEHLRQCGAYRQITDNIFFKETFSHLEQKYNLTEEDVTVVEKNTIIINKCKISFSMQNKLLKCSSENESFLVKITNFGQKINKIQIKNKE